MKPAESAARRFDEWNRAPPRPATVNRGPSPVPPSPVPRPKLKLARLPSRFSSVFCLQLSFARPHRPPPLVDFRILLVHSARSLCHFGRAGRTWGCGGKDFDHLLSHNGGGSQKPITATNGPRLRSAAATNVVVPVVAIMARRPGRHHQKRRGERGPPPPVLVAHDFPSIFQATHWRPVRPRRQASRRGARGFLPSMHATFRHKKKTQYARAKVPYTTPQAPRSALTHGTLRLIRYDHTVLYAPVRTTLSAYRPRIHWPRRLDSSAVLHCGLSAARPLGRSPLQTAPLTQQFAGHHAPPRAADTSAVYPSSR